MSKGSNATTGTVPRRQGSSEPMPHLTPGERAARGKAARAEVPRSRHGEWTPIENRPDPIALLEQQATTRVPELLPIRYGRMAHSPFAFYRGAAYVMASDLAATPRSGLMVQACGDAHLSNFGVYGSPERNLVFDINDFDETLPGPWEWDVKRLVTSLEIAARGNGFSDKERRSVVLAATAKYRSAMHEFAAMRNLDVWYAHLDMERFVARFGSLVDPKRLKAVEANLAKARTRDSLHAYEKLTRVIDGEPRIVSQPPLIVPADELVSTDRDELVSSIRDMLRAYRRTLETDRRHLLEDFRFIDIARKVVGVGSVGTRAWIILMLGRDDLDPLFIQAKEANASVLESFLGKSEYSNHGQRVVAGQRLMQATSDIFLGWHQVKTGMDGQPHDYYLRQLRDWKGSAEVEAMLPEGMTIYGQMCAWTLARAHARSGDRIAIAAYLGTGDVFDKAIAEFAARYADRNELDHRALVEAVESGRIVAEVGV